MSGVSGHSPHSTTLGKNGGRAGPKQTRSRCTTWELSPNIFREKCFTFVVISLGPQSGSYHSSREGGGVSRILNCVFRSELLSKAFCASIGGAHSNC